MAGLDDAIGQPRSKVVRPKPDELAELAKRNPPLLHQAADEARIHSQPFGDMNTFLEGKVKDGASMRPSCVNKWSQIQLRFTLKERIDALKEFYDLYGDIYPQAKLDFLAQVP